jgi:multiple sugar transport system ATP-binding protein
MTLAQRVAVMDGGRLQQFDTPLNIYERPANKFVAGFMGSPSMNFLNGTLDHSERKFISPDIVLAFRSQALSLPHGATQVVLGVRPENINLSVTEFQGGLPATVYVTESLGNETFVFLNLGKGRIVARTGPAMRLDMESKVWISLDETKLHFFDPVSGTRLP